MTSTIRAGRTASSAIWIFAVVGAATSMALTAYGSFKEEVQPGDVPGWLFINVPVIVVFTALVFGLVAPRLVSSADPDAPARAALLLSLVAVSTVAVANFGFPAVLAAAAGWAATATRRRTGRWSAPGAVAVALSGVAVVGAGLLALVG